MPQSPAPKPPAIKPGHIVLICILAVAIFFVGSIAISIAVIQAEHAAPAPSADSQ
jgi:hypothetical protein